VSLQQIIDGCVERQQVLARGEVLPELIQGQDAVAQQHQHQPPPQPPNQHAHAHATQRLLLPPGLLPSEEEAAQRYAEQYRVFSMRSRVMANQLHDSRAEAAALIASKTVTLPLLLPIAPEGTIDPSPLLYDDAFYTLAGFSTLAFLCNVAAFRIPIKARRAGQEI
jgi:hypothetical protein